MTSPATRVRIDRADRLAEAISLVFHPLVVVVPTMVVLMLQQGIAPLPSLFWAFLSVCIANLPLAFLIFYGFRSGRYSNLSVSIREQRHSIYAFYGLSIVILLVILVFGRAPMILTVCWIAAILTTALGYLINQRFTKLSLHSVGMAGCATVLILTIPMLGVVMALFAPLVGWARIRLKHHTPLQIFIGWAISMLCVLIVFRVFHYW
jgi:membrane-associated phospholipid phosphatase